MRSALPETTAWMEPFYKDLHANPELSFQETRTADLAASKMKEFGYEVLEGVGETGVVGILRNGEGTTVLARADMYALPRLPVYAWAPPTPGAGPLSRAEWVLADLANRCAVGTTVLQRAATGATPPPSELA